jgi:uncharacterized protein
MPRPPCCRRIALLPPYDLFKPAAVPAQELGIVAMGLDEYEALRLSDVEYLQHDEAAAQMGVSRQTFGRILDIAHGKVAAALVGGQALRIEGGPVCPPPHPGWRCQKFGLNGPISPGECPRHRRCPSPGCPPPKEISPTTAAGNTPPKE